jgi:hypothetical protein
MRHEEKRDMDIHARLISKSFLRRIINVSVNSSGKTYRVEYNGRGLGFETVYVDGVRVFRKISNRSVLIPFLDFKIGGAEAAIRIRSGIWPMIRGFALTIQGHRVYAEGKPFDDDCSSCGYNLRGTSSGVCPECGCLISANKLPEDKI